MKAVVAAFNQEKALVGAFSLITNLRMDLFEAPLVTSPGMAWAVVMQIATIEDTLVQENLFHSY